MGKTKLRIGLQIGYKNTCHNMLSTYSYMALDTPNTSRLKSNIKYFCCAEQVIIGNISRIDHVFRCCIAATSGGLGLAKHDKTQNFAACGGAICLDVMYFLLTFLKSPHCKIWVQKPSVQQLSSAFNAPVRCKISVQWKKRIWPNINYVAVQYTDRQIHVMAFANLLFYLNYWKTFACFFTTATA